MSMPCLLQSGLASIRARVRQEICERYGFCEECTRAEPGTMKEVLKLINEKSVTVYIHHMPTVLYYTLYVQYYAP